MKNYVTTLLAALMVLIAYPQDNENKQPKKSNYKKTLVQGDVHYEFFEYQGKLNGPYKEIINSQIILEGFFVNNKEHSTWTSYHANGEKWAEVSFLNGNKHGSWRIWSADGALQYEYSYQNGKPAGTWKAYNHNGEVVAMIQK